MELEYALSRVRRLGCLVYAQERGCYYEKEFDSESDAIEHHLDLVARTTEARAGMPEGYLGSPESVAEIRSALETWRKTTRRRLPPAAYQDAFVNRR